MDKAIASTSEQPPKEGVTAREERVSGGWDRFEVDDRKVLHFVDGINKFVTNSLPVLGTAGDNTTDA